MEQLGLAKEPKPKPEDTLHEGYVYAVFDGNDSVIILFATYAEAEFWVMNWGWGSERIEQIRLGEEL